MSETPKPHRDGLCPRCGEFYSAHVSTTNEWIYVCDRCDIRFNRLGEEMLPYRPGDTPPHSTQPEAPE